MGDDHLFIPLSWTKIASAGATIAGERVREVRVSNTWAETAEGYLVRMCPSNDRAVVLAHDGVEREIPLRDLEVLRAVPGFNNLSYGQMRMRCGTCGGEWVPPVEVVPATRRLDLTFLCSSCGSEAHVAVEVSTKQGG